MNTPPIAHRRTTLHALAKGGLLVGFFFVSSLQPSRAESATWNPNAAASDWNTATNWTPATVPNGPSDNATFDTSSQKFLSISNAGVELNNLIFDAGASAFTINIGGTWYLSLSGVGVTNDSGVTQTFTFSLNSANFNTMVFSNSATAGTSTSYIMDTGAFMEFYNTSTAGGGTFSLDNYSLINFHDKSTAGSGNFVLSGGDQFGSAIYFEDSTNAGSGTFTLNGTGAGCTIIFYTSQNSAGSAVFTINGAGPTSSGVSSVGLNCGTAASATFIANAGADFGRGGGKISLAGDCNGATCRIKVFGKGAGAVTDGTFDISGHFAPGVTIGSIEGNGLVLLGSNNLTVGSNNLDTSFSGVLTGTGGSFTKTGTGTLTISGADDFAGPIVVNKGKLSVTGSIVSSVTINTGGTLGGGGTVGSVTVKSGGVVAPSDPQSLRVDGNYQQFSGGRLALAMTGTLPGSYDQVVVQGAATLSSGSILELDFTQGFAPHLGDVFNLLTTGFLTGTFSSVDIVGLEPGFQYSLAPDGGGHFQLIALSDGVSTTTVNPSNLLNISTRLSVQTGDDVLIGGFIITGDTAKRVLLRGIGPSLSQFGVGDALADPTLELHESDGTVVADDNWRDTQEQEILDTNLPPSEDNESAIVATLDPGAYTAILAGKNGGIGVGLVEVYDLDSPSVSQLANISTRGLVQTGDNVIIGGCIIGGGDSTAVILRALGPSLANSGISNPLSDPTIELHDQHGALVAFDDDWKDSQQAQIEAANLAPTDDRESAIGATLPPAAYTIIVQGKGGSTGVGIVEAYNLH